jgi:hypothetical protein
MTASGFGNAKWQEVNIMELQLVHLAKVHKLVPYLVPQDEGMYLLEPDSPGVDVLEMSRYLFWDKVRPDERN